MKSNFTKGMVMGTLIGASIGLLVHNEPTNTRSRKRMMRNGKSLLRKSGHIINDIVDLIK